MQDMWNLNLTSFTRSSGVALVLELACSAARIFLEETSSLVVFKVAQNTESENEFISQRLYYPAIILGYRSKIALKTN